MARQRSRKSRSQVFVDSSAWIALVDQSDEYCQRAEEVFLRLRMSRRLLLTTEYVLLEVANSSSRFEHRGRAVELIERLRTDQTILIKSSTAQLFEFGWQLFKSRPDKSWSLTDCISFVVMQRLGIGEAFTSDKHFEQAGFVKLL